MSEDEVALARRMYAERGSPPSEVAAASSIIQTESAKSWRCRSPGSAFDTLVSEYLVPVSVASFVAMMWQVEGRTAWDTSAKAAEVLDACGPTELTHLHRQAADCQLLFMSMAAPAPLKTREYVMTRAVCKLEPTSPGVGPPLFCWVDRAVDEASSLAFKPRGTRVNRVTTYWSITVAWPLGATATMFAGTQMHETARLGRPST